MAKAVIVIPTLNEADHIATVVSSLSEPTNSGSLIPIWIVDGLSQDETCEVVKRMQLQHVEVIENPQQTQAHAVNIAAEKACSLGEIDYLIRVDAHAVYKPDFVSTVLSALQETDAESVVVPLHTIGGSRLQDAASILFNTWLGNGGSPHRMGLVRGYVDHGHHAGFKLKPFLRLGGYDTGFLANEDAEFDYRLKKSGGKIFLENRISVDYVPRDSLKGTFRQYSRNGTYRMRRAFKHNIGLGMRQFVPAFLLPATGASILIAILYVDVFWLLPLMYISGISIASILIAGQHGKVRLAGLVVGLAAASHFGFSWGASIEYVRCRFSKSRREKIRSDGPRLISVGGGSNA